MPLFYVLQKRDGDCTSSCWCFAALFIFLLLYTYTLYLTVKICRARVCLTALTKLPLALCMHYLFHRKKSIDSRPALMVFHGILNLFIARELVGLSWVFVALFSLFIAQRLYSIFFREEMSTLSRSILGVCGLIVSAYVLHL